MVLINNNENLSQASGVINIGLLQSVYESFMDEALLDMGRVVTFHLDPSIEQDTTTQSQPQASQYNPFFGGVPVPRTNTRRSGVKITPRDVQYTAHIVVGPRGADDTEGIGDLKDNQVQLTVVAEALEHVNAAVEFTVEGRRYTVDETRPVGLVKRSYLMVFGTEINKADAPTTDNTVG